MNDAMRAWKLPAAAAALAWFVLPSLAGGFVASGLGLTAAAIVLFALVGRDQVHHFAAPLGGAIACAVAFVSPAAWLVTTFTLSALLVVAELVGVARVARARDAAWLLGVAIGIPVAFGCAIAMAGAGDVLAGTLRASAPASPMEIASLTMCRALIAVVLLRPAEVGVRLGMVLGAASLVLLLARVATVAALARIDAELFWPESPMLINALKLENREALYGAPAALDSYSYSPLLDVTHRMLLRPFGLQLELHAHRALILFDQVVAFAVLLWALWPRLRTLPAAARAAAACALAFAALSNLIAPAVHPDHPLLLCFAIAVALVLSPERMPPRVRDVALLMLTPVATGFKLSGAGIGAALAILAIARRDTRSLKILVVSGALTIATIPLFDVLFGRFSFYAIAVQRSHPMDWSRLLQTPYVWFFAYAAGGAVAFFLARRMVAPAERRVALSLLVLAVVILLFSLPATAKYAGRENNLALSFVATTALLVLLATQAPRFAGALISFAIWGALHTRPPTKPITEDERRALAEETAMLAAIVAHDTREGERTLLLTSVLPWIRGGRTDVPHDRYHSAIELYFGHFPEGESFPARIASGTYRTVIASGGELLSRSGPSRGFQEAVQQSIERGYVERPRVPALKSARVYDRALDR